MHLHITNTETAAVEVEDNIIMFCKQRHGNAGIGNFLGNHESGQTLTEGIVMMSGMPD